MEGVEQHDLLAVRIERTVVADPVDLDPGEIAAQRDVGPPVGPAGDEQQVERKRGAVGPHASPKIPQVARPWKGRRSRARVPTARVPTARGWAAAPRGSAAGRFRAWLIFVNNI